jgi:hypothetical protein
VIFPVAVTLKRFLALEFVFTLGILPSILFYTLEALPTGGSLSNLFRKWPGQGSTSPGKWGAKIRLRDVSAMRDENKMGPDVPAPFLEIYS